MGKVKCEHCGCMVDNLISLTDHPDYFDGSYCEKCLDKHFS